MKLPEWARRRRSGWEWDGSARPPFADEPEPGQESVWDYPRPPRLSRDDRRVVVRLGKTVIADTTGAIRALETASPPTFYVPPGDVETDFLTRVGGVSYCEWKGEATFWTVQTPTGESAERAAWSYPEPFTEFVELRDYLSFYPGHLQCTVDDEVVRPQGGEFYGGWITSEIAGPFKGDPGAGAW